MVAAELARLLAKGPYDVECVRREATASTATPRNADHAIPPLYVVDACGPIQQDLAVVRQLREESPEARVLVIGESFGPPSAIPFLRLGVKGLLSYGEVRRRFAEAVGQVVHGRLWVSRDLVSAFVESVTQAAPRGLPDVARGFSRREQEVLRGVLENRSNKEIGLELHISERTAKFHVANLLRKVGVRRRSDLVVQWAQGRPRGALTAVGDPD
jgi:DNA-binding NarL/FixJ family response regulator